MSRWYICEYKNGATFGSEIWANSWGHAQKVARARGIGEIVMRDGGRKPMGQFPSELMRKRVLNKRHALEVIHGVTFLAFVALKSGKATVDEVVSDRGFLHEAIHACEFGRCGQAMSTTRQAFAKTILEWERRVPGFRGT